MVVNLRKMSTLRDEKNLIFVANQNVIYWLEIISQYGKNCYGAFLFE